MTPIIGINQVVDAGNCPKQFILLYQQSCVLTLQLTGSALNGHVLGGPEVCQESNSLQCYQPSRANSLDISVSDINLNSTAATKTEVGINYIQTNVAFGGEPPYIYSFLSGALPAGTTLNTSTGTVSGTPTTSGPFSYQIRVTDSKGAAAQNTISGIMAGLLILTSTPSASTKVGVAYSQTNVVSGGQRLISTVSYLEHCLLAPHLILQQARYREHRLLQGLLIIKFKSRTMMEPWRKILLVHPL